MKTVFLILTLFAVIAGCAVLGSQGVENIFRETDGFSFDRITSRSAVINKDSLMSGKVPYFIEFGADSCFAADYRRGAERYSVEVVSFRSYKGSLGAFYATDLPGGYPVEIGDAARRNDSLVSFVSGGIIVTVAKGCRGSMGGAEELARALLNNIEKPPLKPDLFSFLPAENRIEDSGLYFMGQRVFRERISKELAEVLLLEFAREGAVAKYRVDGGEVELMKIRFFKPERAKAALNSYLKSRADRPVILPRQSLEFYTVVNRDMSESYIADYAEWVYFMPKNPQNGGGKKLFEYVLRGGK